ncbi:hypothetical protein BDV32DRAFT_117727 [Aspergillus pseudonomiae]|nr:hypothetical protein BDV32DRAFT_117727 [Aspergillus pseudonomiae]
MDRCDSFENIGTFGKVAILGCSTIIILLFHPLFILDRGNSGTDHSSLATDRVSPTLSLKDREIEPYNEPLHRETARCYIVQFVFEATIYTFASIASMNGADQVSYISVLKLGSLRSIWKNICWHPLQHPLGSVPLDGFLFQIQKSDWSFILARESPQI